MVFSVKVVNLTKHKELIYKENIGPTQNGEFEVIKISIYYSMVDTERKVVNVF